MPYPITGKHAARSKTSLFNFNTRGYLLKIWKGIIIPQPNKRPQIIQKEGSFDKLTIGGY